MIKKNIKMSCLINSVNGENIIINQKILIEEKINILFNRMKQVNNCLILNTPTFNVNDETIIKKLFTDDIGFEASQNEVNLNVVFKSLVITVPFAIEFFNTFNYNLRTHYPNDMFCAILSLSEDADWIYRFHHVREGIKLWISDDIESYNNPVMYEVI